MWFLDQLAEEKMRLARERGEFDNLPGAGKRLNLDDDTMIPESLRAGYRMLKNAGYIPPEVEALKTIEQVEQLIQTATRPSEANRLCRRKESLVLQLELRGHHALAMYLRARGR